MFWNIENIDPHNVAVIDAATDESLTYGELASDVIYFSEFFRSNKKTLAFLLCDNSIRTVRTYISLLRAGVAVLLVDAKMDSELLRRLVTTYNPEFIFVEGDYSFNNYISENEKGLSYYKNNKEMNCEIYDDLAVLLSTSGTTGSPKLVKLSYKNLQSNAASINKYLKISCFERPITSLPMSYSYGLSIINSHLFSGATIVLTNASFVLRNFWKEFNKYECTSFAGVPYSYQILKKTKFEKLELPTLTTLTQAGGRLSEEFVKFFHEYSTNRNINFFVMYGQTEATARISYVPAEKLGEKIGSIGIPIPNGTIKIYDAENEISEIDKEGELVYSGENVMLGYATTQADLINGNELQGVLRTGDLVKRDEDGYFYITGRMKRFLKIFGLRLNLDEVEKMVENQFQFAAACVGNDDLLIVLAQTNDSEFEMKIHQKICEVYKLHRSVIKIHCIKKIPVTDSGKRDYKYITANYLPKALSK